MYISKVESNVNSPDGRAWSQPLDRLTLIVGPSAGGFVPGVPGSGNGKTKGKTAILRALTLALGAYADEVQGRDSVKDEHALVTLAPLRGAPGDELYAAVYSEDEVKAPGKRVGFYSCHVEEDGKIPDAAHEVAGAWEAPLFWYPIIRDALFGSESARREAVVRWAGERLTLDDVTRCLDERFRAKWQDIASKRVKPSVPETLASVADYVAESKRTLESEARTWEKDAEGRKKRLGPRPIEASVKDAQEAKARAQAALEDAIRASAGPPQPPAVEPPRRTPEADQAILDDYARSEGLHDELKVAEAALAEWKAMALPDVPEVPGEEPVFKLASETAKEASRVRLASCPVCGHVPVDWPALIRAMDSAREYQRHINTGVVKAREEALRYRRDVADSVSGWEAEVARIKGELAQLPDYDTQVLPAWNRLQANDYPEPTRFPLFPQAPTIDPVFAARSALQQAEALLRDLEKAEADWKAHDDAVAKGKRARDDAKLYGEFRRDLDAAAEQVSASLIPAFVARVQKRMPEGLAFTVTPDFRPGLVRKGATETDPDFTDTSLSGTERIAVVGAVLGAVVDFTKPAILAISSDDVDVDESALYDLMDGWASMPVSVQVILTSTKHPRRKGKRGAPKGWTVVDLYPKEAK